MDDKLSIRLNIGDKFYPMFVKKEEEELIRKAGKIINDKLTIYKKKYSKSSTIDLMAMSLLQLTKELLDLKEKANLSTINDDLKIVNTELEEYINQNK